MASPQLSASQTTKPDVEHDKVRVRVSKPDIFQGLKGHDYIKARNLDRPVQRVQTSALANQKAAQ